MVVVLSIGVLIIILMLLPRCYFQLLTVRVEYSYSYLGANLRLF